MSETFWEQRAVSAAEPPMNRVPERACAQPGVNPEIFYPTQGGQSAQAEALAVCHSCPIEAMCLIWAVKTGQGWGIWGGTSEEVRRKLIRKYRAHLNQGE